MGSLLTRYKAGEIDTVWTELRKMDDSVWDDALILEDAQQIAHIAMTRVRQNIETIVERLTSFGYVFDDTDTVHESPSDDLVKMITLMEAAFGELPIVLKAWFEVVGCVNFNGYLPINGGDRFSWTHNQYPDPLVFEYWLDYFQDEYALLKREEAESGETKPFPMYVAPDDIHKENISGGPPYTILLPNRTIDPPVENMWFEATMIQYLQRCMKWGGFPGLSRYDFPPMNVIERLKADLVMF